MPLFHNKSLLIKIHFVASAFEASTVRSGAAANKPATKCFPQLPPRLKFSYIPRTSQRDTDKEGEKP